MEMYHRIQYQPIEIGTSSKLVDVALLRVQLSTTITIQHYTRVAKNRMVLLADEKQKTSLTKMVSKILTEIPSEIHVVFLNTAVRLSSCLTLSKTSDGNASNKCVFQRAQV